MEENLNNTSLKPLRQRRMSLWLKTSNHSIYLTKLGLIVSFLFSVLLALLLPSVIEIWYTIGTIVIPGLLIPILASYFERMKISSTFAFLSMLLGWLTSLCWMLVGFINGNSGNYPLDIEPMYPGLGISFIIWGIGRTRMFTSLR